MRIVMDVRTMSDHFPGIGRYTYQLASAIARHPEGNELVLISNPASVSTRFTLADVATRPGVRIVGTDANPFSLREQLRLPGELRRLNPSVLHFPYVVMPFAAPRPLVLTLHDIIPILFPHFFSLRQRLLFRLSLRIALRAAEVVICVSEATRKDILSWSDPSKLVVIHEGIEEAFYPRTPAEIENLRKAKALPQQYFLYLGSNKPHKNLPALIHGYALLKTQVPLVIAGGEDPRFIQARHQVEKLGVKNRVLFLGAVKEEDLPSLYSGAQAFVFPSLYEGFGLPPLEAMACGVPVACSSIPSLRETAGEAALFFEPENHASIAEAMERILTDQALRAQLRAAGLQRAAEFSWDVTAGKTLAALSKAAKA